MKTRYMSCEAAEKDCPDDGTIHALPGVARYEDYYVVALPEQVIMKKIPQTVSIRNSKFWNSCHLIIGDECVVLYASVHRAYRVIEKKLDISKIEIREYLQGHRTPTEFWGNKNIK